MWREEKKEQRLSQLMDEAKHLSFITLQLRLPDKNKNRCSQSVSQSVSRQRSSCTVRIYHGRQSNKITATSQVLGNINNDKLSASGAEKHSGQSSERCFVLQEEELHLSFNEDVFSAAINTQHNKKSLPMMIKSPTLPIQLHYDGFIPSAHSVLCLWLEPLGCNKVQEHKT